MPKVLIDGVEYVPAAAAQRSEATNEAAEKALGHLVFLHTIYGVNGMCRGARGCIWDAIEALDPRVAKMDPSSSEFHDLWGARWGDEEDR